MAEFEVIVEHVKGEGWAFRIGIPGRGPIAYGKEFRSLAAVKRAAAHAWSEAIGGELRFEPAGESERAFARAAGR